MSRFGAAAGKATGYAVVLIPAIIVAAIAITIIVWGAR
jgi:hypothetical protein